MLTLLSWSCCWRADGSSVGRALLACAIFISVSHFSRSDTRFLYADSAMSCLFRCFTASWKRFKLTWNIFYCWKLCNIKQVVRANMKFEQNNCSIKKKNQSDEMLTWSCLPLWSATVCRLENLSDSIFSVASIAFWLSGSDISMIWWPLSCTRTMSSLILSNSLTPS